MDELKINPNPQGDWVSNILKSDLEEDVTKSHLTSHYEIGPPRATPTRTRTILTEHGYVGLYNKKT